jgi:hypothetical protein
MGRALQPVIDVIVLIGGSYFEKGKQQQQKEEKEQCACFPVK